MRSVSIWLRSSAAAVLRAPQLFFRAGALAAHLFDFQLALRHGLRNLLARLCQPVDFHGRGFFLFSRARPLAFDSRQVLVDLR